MTEDNTSIHEFDLDILVEYFSNFKRQGPGSPEVTVKALSFIDNLSNESLIADLGCGTGDQTRILAKHATGHITGLDLFQTYIDLFNKNVAKEGLEHRLEGVVGSMDKLPFQKESLDLIWSEGAIYNIGFERGLSEWREFLKPGGYVAVTEASWFTEKRPAEIFDFWNREYPGIDTIPNQIAQMQNAGYIPVASFILPEHCWTKNYHEPQVPIMKVFLDKHKGNKTAEALVAYQLNEAQMYEKYKEFYGYTFFIGKKI